MVKGFFLLAMVVTIGLAILTALLLVCQWVIYFRVEQTMVTRRHRARTPRRSANE